MIVTATADSNYIDYLRVFVKSTLKYNSQYKFLAQLVDCNDAVKEEFENLGCNVKVIESPQPLDRTKKFFKDDDFEDLMKWTPRKYKKGIIDQQIRKKMLFSAYECFCTHARFPYINDVLHSLQPDECCIVADADTIVRKKLTFIENALYKSELCMRFDDSKKNIEFINEGFMGIRNTATTRRFFNHVANTMKEPSAEINWDYDTYALSKAYIEYPTIKLHKLPQRYKDNELKEESAVWSGSSLTKDNDTYKKEMEMYG